MISHKDLVKMLSYDPETGAFTWREGYERTYLYRGGEPKIAGGLDSQGYIRINIGGKVYKGHRLAWFYVHGEWPPTLLDHANRKRSDNRIGNLRLSTHSQNAMNRVGKVGKSGARGVYWDARDSVWVVKAKLNGKLTYIGRSKLIEEAQALHQGFIDLHHKDFQLKDGS